jgi:predicted DNA-binding transcriptional regulator AlpA
MKKQIIADVYGFTLAPGTLVQDKICAAALGVSRSKIWAMVTAGLLHPVRLGNRCTRFRTDEIIELMG